MVLMGSFYEKKSASCWDEIYDHYKNYCAKRRQWIFRGHGNSNWELRTSLERVMLDFRDQGDISDEGKKDAVYKQIATQGLGDTKWKPGNIEQRLLRVFRRKSHHYISAPPDRDNLFEWLTLMQHYGAPTRLLDFTYSFFVALYFAIESAESAPKEFAVWAIDSDSLIKADARGEAKEYKTLLRSFEDRTTEKFFSKYFWKTRKKARATVINAHRLNDRLVLHQGVFVCPANMNTPFSDNLAATLSKQPNPKKGFHKLVIKAKPEERRRILLHLRRMNVSRASLFPGLQGFGESLSKTYLALTDVMPPKFT